MHNPTSEAIGYLMGGLGPSMTMDLNKSKERPFFSSLSPAGVPGQLAGAATSSSGRFISQLARRGMPGGLDAHVQSTCLQGQQPQQTGSVSLLDNMDLILFARRHNTTMTFPEMVGSRSICCMALSSFP